MLFSFSLLIDTLGKDQGFGFFFEKDKKKMSFTGLQRGAAVYNFNKISGFRMFGICTVSPCMRTLDTVH